MTPFTRYCNFPIRWIEKKLILALIRHNIDLIENVLSSMTASAFPDFFLINIQHINILSCFEQEHYRHFQKNKLFLPRLVVHFHCHTQFLRLWCVANRIEHRTGLQGITFLKETSWWEQRSGKIWLHHILGTEYYCNQILCSTWNFWRLKSKMTSVGVMLRDMVSGHGGWCWVMVGLGDLSGLFQPLILWKESERVISRWKKSF